MRPAKDDLGELLWIFYGIATFVLFVIGAIEFVNGHRHSVNFWLVIASWMTTFAALAWGSNQRRSRNATSAQPPAPAQPLQAGQRETGHEWEDEPGHRRWERTVRPDDRAESEEGQGE